MRWAAILAGSFWLLCGRFAQGDDIKPATDAPPPLSPEQSVKRFRLPEGFRIELVASEPFLADPAGMAFDARGRIVVCEIHGYNLDGYYDIVELNKAGVLDTAVRRVPASKEALERAEHETYGTVKLLEDTDGDGQIDRATVWADRLPACYGLAPARDGVVVLCAPDIVYLADRDGDGKAEVRETLFTGFGVGELWTRISNPRWGVDNWIYGASGAGSAGTIRGPRLSGEVRLGNTGFRFKPDGSRLEPVSGGTSGFGLALSDWDDQFLCTNQQHALYVAPLPHHYLARNPHYAAPAPVINISSYGHPARVFPTSQPDPWRLARGRRPEWVKFYGPIETSAGLLTSACGPFIYRADQFPAEYQGNHFSCEPAQNLIHRCLLEPDGASFTVKRASENVEFLTSTDQWFRPVQLTTGPDGTLYIVDMYREIIEDYSAVPRYLQQQYMQSLINGHDRGRIWRVIAVGQASAGSATNQASDGSSVAMPAGSPLHNLSSLDLVGQLSSCNAWRRETAQRLLVERGRGTPGVIESLTELVRHGNTAQGRLHALYTLDGLGALDSALIQVAASDSHPGVRLHALRLADAWLDRRPTLREKAFAMIDDPDAKVRLQVAFTLGESRDEKKWPALVAMASRHGNDRWMQAAIMSSVAESPGRLFHQIVGQGEAAGPGRQLIKPLASVVGTRQQDEEIGDLLRAIAGYQAADTEAFQIDCLNGLIEGLKRGKPRPLSSAAGQAALRQLLTSSSGPVRGLSLQIVAQVKLTETAEMLAAFATATKESLDASRSIQSREAALALLSSAPYSTLAPTAKQLLGARQPLEVQLAAVAALAACDDPAVGTALLEGWNGCSPKVQTAVLDAIFSRRNRLPALLDAMSTGAVPPQTLDSLRRAQLLNNPDEKIRRQAESLLAGPATDKGRHEVLERYQAALAGERDPRRGQKLFAEHCSKCHQLKGEGYQVGPDLAAAKDRPDQTILLDILQPSDQITAGFRSYLVVTENGRIFTGVLAAETATSVTLRGEKGAEQSILRKDIEDMQGSSVSLMPDSMEKLVTPQDLADVIGYLREALGPPSLTLFDDDGSFPALLDEGRGKATVVTDDHFSGIASLAITPPQRFSARIQGWSFRIAENPGPGEFRYMRFAWKSPRGEGVMIELAAAGAWPPAEKPLRRYYSGKNTTGWQATQIAAQVPREWTVVTVDLWKDFGPFTLTGIAPTAMGGTALFDRIELLRTLDAVSAGISRQ